MIITPYDFARRRYIKSATVNIVPARPGDNADFPFRVGGFDKVHDHPVTIPFNTKTSSIQQRFDFTTSLAGQVSAGDIDKALLTVQALNRDPQPPGVGVVEHSESSQRCHGRTHRQVVDGYLTGLAILVLFDLCEPDFPAFCGAVFQPLTMQKRQGV